MEDRRKKVLQFFVRVLLFLISVIVGGWWYFSYYKPNHEFELLLSGEDRVGVTSLVITGQGKQVIVTDPASMLYITKAFRAGLRNSYKLGNTYYVDVYLSSGGSVRCAIYVPEDNGYITVCFPVDAIAPDSMIKYLICLHKPIPERLSKVLSELRC